MLDLIVILAIFLLVLNSNRRIARKYAEADRPMLVRSLNGLFVYHCIFSFLFPLIPGDSLGYWYFSFEQIVTHSDKIWDYWGVGTIFLLFLDFIPARIMGLSFLTGNFLYGVLGFLGMRYLFRLFIEKLKVNVKIFGLPVIPFLFYFPNMNFWTAGVGKDTLCFFGIACFLYSLMSFGKRIIPLVLSFALVYYIRPPMAMILMGGATIGIVFSGKVKLVYRLLVPVAALGVFFMAYSQVAKFLKVDDLSVKSLQHVATDKAIILSRGATSSSINISGYSVPFRLFTYLYRPLFFDVHNFISLSASIENLVYLLITIMWIKAVKWRDFRQMPFWMVTGGVIFLLAMLVFSNSLGNLGIIMRMKNMTMIYFLFVMIWSMSEREAEQKLIQPS